MYMENLFIAFIKSEILTPRHLYNESYNLYEDMMRGDSK